MPALLKTTQIQEPSSASVNLTLDTSGNGTFAGTAVMSSPYTMRNKIINGAMMIDQRNAGASTTMGASTYSVDRFLNYKTSGGTITAQQSTTAPTGFSNSIVYTVTSASSATSLQQCVFLQKIEAFNTVDFNSGTANPTTITLSFWVRSSLIGTYCVYFVNSSYNRSYVTTYNISVANTWEYKTITLTCDSTGTWPSGTNAQGFQVGWSLGSGSNYTTATVNAWQSGEYQQTSAQANFCGTASATFYITGVQLERGTVATPFEYRNYQQELAMCQRYARIFGTGMLGRWGASTGGEVYTTFPPMRASPTMSLTSTTGLFFRVGIAQVNATSVALSSSVPSANGTQLNITMAASSASAGEFMALMSDIVFASAEL